MQGRKDSPEVVRVVFWGLRQRSRRRQRKVLGGTKVLKFLNACLGGQAFVAWRAWCLGGGRGWVPWAREVAGVATTAFWKGEGASLTQLPLADATVALLVVRKFVNNHAQRASTTAARTVTTPDGGKVTRRVASEAGGGHGVVFSSKGPQAKACGRAKKLIPQGVLEKIFYLEPKWLRTIYVCVYIYTCIYIYIRSHFGSR